MTCARSHTASLRSPSMMGRSASLMGVAVAADGAKSAAFSAEVAAAVNNSAAKLAASQWERGGIPPHYCSFADYFGALPLSEIFFSATAFMQYRNPDGRGPSGNT